MRRSFLIFAFLVAGNQALLRAEAPAWYMEPVVTHDLQMDKKLPGGIHYLSEGSTVRVLIDPEKCATKPGALGLELESDGVMSRCTIVVARGGTFRSVGGTFNDVGFICQPGGVIELENCSLGMVYITQDIKSPAGGNAAKLSLKDCTLSNSHIESAHACSLTARGCRFVDCLLNATEKDGQAESASYLGCVFSSCLLSKAEVLMASSKSLFDGCVYTGVWSDAVGAYLEKPVLVQLMWKSPTPLPASAGKVHFEIMPSQADTMSAVGASKDGLANMRTLNHNHRLISSLGGGSKGVSPASSSAPSAPVPEKGVIIAAAAGSGAFKSRITSVNGLLISQLSSGEEAGQVSKLTLTALPSTPGQATTLKFNQDVGDDMQKALNEVSKFAQLRHNGLPAGHAVELGFADKYIAKDGPSAAVACALLLETAITGKELDPTFAVTSDMNADGSVQPIGGVAAKVRGATKGGCKIVGIPVNNEKAIPDLLLLEGPMPLVQIGIFSVSKFDEALALAEPKRADALARALAELENVRGVLMRLPASQMTGMLRSPQAQARLQYILQAAPNCISAKYLLLYGQGRGPRSLSIGGSIEAADGSAMGLIKSIENDVEKNVNTLKGDEVGSSINKLKNLRPKLDPRVWPYVDNIISYGEVIRGSILNPVRSGARYFDLVGKARQSAQAAKAAFEKLTGDPQVREELGL